MADDDGGKDDAGGMGGNERLPTTYDVELAVARPGAASERARERWKVSEPWRLRARKRAAVKTVLVLAVIAAALLALSLLSNSEGLAPAAVVGVMQGAGGRPEVVFWGCHGEQMLRLVVDESADPPTDITGADTVWWVGVSGTSGPSGHLTFTPGVQPAGMITQVAAAAGLPGVPVNQSLWLIATTDQRVYKVHFSKAVLTSGLVSTAAGAFDAKSYDQQGAVLCGAAG
ncbi:MAG TPA: hypothetical protein VGS21_07345 [Acidimicrobiales bacterium]|nr:hypothetical protein [Acidimicrobiales bacterium]